MIVHVAAYSFVVLSLCALAAQATGQLAGMVAQLVPTLTASSAPPKTKSAEVPPAAPKKAAMSVPQYQTQGSVVLAQGWGGYGRDRSFWRKRDRERDGDDWWNSRDGDDNDERRADQSNTYRTVCVRLCDGYYWPISYATTPEGFDRDRQKCESSCGSPVRLYRGKTGAEIDDMEDQTGQPYRRLRNAFLYRTQYDAACKCKAEPWSKEATDRHKVYALEAARSKGDKVAAQQLKDMKAALEAERRQALATARSTISTSPAVAANTATDSADGPTEGESGTRRPANNERMSLGVRPPAPPAKSSSKPVRIWAQTSDSAP